MDEQDDCIEFHNIVVALSVISKAFKHFKLFVTSLPFIGFFTLLIRFVNLKEENRKLSFIQEENASKDFSLMI